MKDIAFDVQERDLVFTKHKNITHTLNVVWGVLFNADSANRAYMNIVLSSQDIANITGDQEGLIVNANAQYYPSNNEVVVRFVVFDESTQEYTKGDEFKAVSYFNNWIEPSEIKACQLPLVNSDGEYTICIKNDIAYIYSSSLTDILVEDASNQESQLLIQCNPGNLYRFPMTGIQATQYINSIPEHTDIAEVIVEQYRADNKSVHEAEFDAVTGNLNIGFSNMQEESIDLGAEGNLGLDISELVANYDDVRQAIRDNIDLTYNKENGKAYSNIDAFRDILTLSDTIIGVDKEMKLNVDENADEYFKLKLTPTGHLYRE